MYSSIDEYIAGLLTRDEIAGLLAEIERVKEAAYKTEEGDLEQVLRARIGERPAMFIKDELEKSDKMADIGFQKEYFSALTAKLKNIPMVNLEMAFEPSRELLSKIREKLSEYANVQVAVDYKVVPELLAGVRVAFGGKYFDFSLNSMWPDVWNVVKDKLKPKA